MCRKGQSTLEYVFLIGIVAVSIAAMLVYMKRGFQGNIRTYSDQLGAGSYSSGNTTASNTQQKKAEIEIVSQSTTSVTYGNSHRLPDDILTLKSQAKELQETINSLATQLHAAAKHSATWEALKTQLSTAQETMRSLEVSLTTKLRKWQAQPKTPDQTVATSSNIESGTQTDTRHTDESLGAMSGDRW